MGREPTRLRPRCRAIVATLAFMSSSSTTRAHTAPHPLSLLRPPRIALDEEITVSVGPTLLFNSGEWVTVAWTGIEGWMYPDAFVAAFSPGSVLEDPARITEVAPVKYQFIAAGRPLPEGDERAIHKFVVEELAKEQDEEEEQGFDERHRLDSAGVGGEGKIVRTELRGADGVQTDAQSLRFRLLNLRDEEGYRFGLFTGGLTDPVLVAMTKDAVKFARPYEVTNLHLALTEDASAMRVSWSTGWASQSPAVRFRQVNVDDGHQVDEAEEAATWQVTPAQTGRYTRDDLCGAPASTNGFHDPGPLQSAIMDDLLPGTPYEYQAGDSEAQEWSASSFFFAPPQAGAADGKTQRVSTGQKEASFDEGWGSDAVKVAVFGDMGTAEADETLDAGHTEELPSIKTVGILREHLKSGVRGDKEAFTGRPALGVGPGLGMVLHIGDLSYARGFDTQWDEFFEQISPVASKVPWMVAVGNHERDFPDRSSSIARQNVSYFTGSDSGGDCGVPTAFRFLMPGAAGNPFADTPWYGFNFGPIHFTVMSTEHDFTPGSPQRAFLEKDLSSVDRSQTPWLVFAGHRPMYVNSGGPGASDCEYNDDDGPAEEHCANDQPVAALMRSSLEPLLLQNQVDLALYGHHHSYQRTCKVEGEVCNGISAGYPRGSRGENIEGIPDMDEGYVAPVHVVMGMAGMGLSQNMVEPRPSWVEYATDREFGLGMIVADSSTLKLSFILDSDGEVADEMWLARSPSASEEAKRSRDFAKELGEAHVRRSKRATW